MRICSRLLSYLSLVPHATCPRESAVRHDPHPEESHNGTDDGFQSPFRVGYAIVRLPLRICTWEREKVRLICVRWYLPIHFARPYQSLFIPLSRLRFITSSALASYGIIPIHRSKSARHSFLFPWTFYLLSPAPVYVT